ncbi:hypothetical protein NEOLEDRAFT_1245140 [Neolentinus lepideus HHB14362 ss-1]|uniref:Uncharacterized protein n=1 Tax=Neolentinus lepideus HHB14362 ss-1 TaxID=1314782 RepID=A0A165P6I9_9AGAM|nr:hypothetical protein NEOLEDRAFT_1245140 [Neolentinus lepideus HHB14362 ss-1]
MSQTRAVYKISLSSFPMLFRLSLCLPSRSRNSVLVSRLPMAFMAFFIYELLQVLALFLIAYAILALSIVGAMAVALHYGVILSIYIIQPTSAFQRGRHMSIWFCPKKENEYCVKGKQASPKEEKRPQLTLTNPSGVSLPLPAATLTYTNVSIAAGPAIPSPNLLNRTHSIRKSFQSNKSNSLFRTFGRPRSYAFYGGKHRLAVGPSFDLPVPVITLVDASGDVVPLPFTPTIFLTKPSGATIRLSVDRAIRKHRDIMSKGETVYDTRLLCPWAYQPMGSSYMTSHTPDAPASMPLVENSLGLSHSSSMINLADLADALDDDDMALQQPTIIFEEQVLACTPEVSLYETALTDQAYVPTLEQLKSRKTTTTPRIITVAMSETGVANMF